MHENFLGDEKLLVVPCPTFFECFIYLPLSYKTYLEDIPYSQFISYKYNILLASSYNTLLILKHIHLLENITYLYYIT